MPSVTVPIDTGVSATGALGPINNAESLVGGFAFVGSLGIKYFAQALRAPVGSGHIVFATTTDIIIDATVDLLNCMTEPHKLTVVLPDGSVESRYLLAACGDTSGTASLLTVEVPFSVAPDDGAPWILTDGVEVGAGHVVSGTVSSVTLDSSVDLDICGSYTLTVFKPDGTGVEAQDTVTDCGEHSTVTLEDDLAVAPSPGWIWTLRDAPIGWQNVTVTSVAGVRATGILGGAQATGNPAAVPVFGIGMVSALGAVTIRVDINVALPGQVATGAVGSAGFRSDQPAAVVGLVTTPSLGAVTVTQGSDASVTGRSATGLLGTVSVNVHMPVSATGQRADAQLGVVVFGTENQFPVFGQFAEVLLGQVGVAVPPGIVAGVQAAGAVGSVSVASSANAVFVSVGHSSIAAVGGLQTMLDSDAVVRGVAAEGVVGNLFGGQPNIATPFGVRATGRLGTVAARASNARHRVLWVNKRPV